MYEYSAGFSGLSEHIKDLVEGILFGWEWRLVRWQWRLSRWWRRVVPYLPYAAATNGAVRGYSISSTLPSIDWGICHFPKHNVTIDTPGQGWRVSFRMAARDEPS